MKILIQIYLKDLLRNRMLGLMVVLVPIIFYPLIYWGITQFIMLKKGFSESRTVELYCRIEEPDFQSVKDSLLTIDNVTLLESDKFTGEKSAFFLQVGSLNGLPKFNVRLDSSKAAHKDVFPKIKTVLTEYYKDRLKELIEKREYNEKYFEVYSLKAENIEGDDEALIKIFSLLIPLFSIISIVGSCVAASVELTSGHSEDKTAETTLTLPISRKKIIVSKFVSVTIYGLMAGILNFSLLMIFMMQLFSIFFSRIDIGISEFDWQRILNFETLTFSFISLTLTAFFTSLIFVAAAGFASKRKEGNVMVSPFMALITYLPLVIIIPAIEPNLLIAATPVLNVVFSIKLIVSGDLNILFLSETLLFSVFWIFIAYKYILPFLLEEEVLLGYSNTSLSKKIKNKIKRWKKK
ncbi:MAG: ABC transporter permease subunit [Candidatus Delongbacteria bacterium]